MKINGGSTGPIRPESARETRGPEAGRAQESNGASSVRVDSVEISEAGRAKAAGSAAGLDPRSARLVAIRQRILGGAYDTDEVVAEVARRILERGDLQPPPTEESQ